MSSFWESCLLHFRTHLPEQQLNTWILPLRMEGEPPALRVIAPNRFVLQWVKDRYLALIQQLATEYFTDDTSVEMALPSLAPLGARSNVGEPSGAPVAAHVAPAGQDADTISKKTGAADSAERAGQSHGNGELRQAYGSRRSADGQQASQGINAASSDQDTPRRTSVANQGQVRRPVDDLPSHRPQDRGNRLNPLFTFDNFVGGRANQLARAAALQVAGHPGKAYNPLFVYGGVGLGKTHLIHAIGNHLLQEVENARVRYVHAEQYVNDVVRAYQHKSFDSFKRYYHSLDLLLIDDIQFFGGKTRTQEEFFFAFNALVETGKQIIITCDSFPKEIQGMEDRLISRFGWGLTVAIEPPELEMRVAILLLKAMMDRMPIDESVAFFVAKHIRSNVRELEGALKRIQAYARFHDSSISLELAREALKDVIAVQNRQVSVDNIQKTVADFYKIKVADMFSKKRSRALARPRQIAMAIAKELTPMSLPDIGDAFGGRDHTTVLHACRKVAELRSEDPIIEKDFQTLIHTLSG